MDKRIIPGQAPCVGCNSYSFIPKMGRYYFVYDTGHTERYPTCIAFHIPTEDPQPDGKGQGWERIQTSNRSIDARK
jgi:hypothetical protein